MLRNVPREPCKNLRLTDLHITWKKNTHKELLSNCQCICFLSMLRGVMSYLQNASKDHVPNFTDQFKKAAHLPSLSPYFFSLFLPPSLSPTNQYTAYRNSHICLQPWIKSCMTRTSWRRRKRRFVSHSLHACIHSCHQYHAPRPCLQTNHVACRSTGSAFLNLNRSCSSQVHATRIGRIPEKS